MEVTAIAVVKFNEDRGKLGNQGTPNGNISALLAVCEYISANINMVISFINALGDKIKKV